MTWKAIIWIGTALLIAILIISYLADGLRALPSGLVAWGTILLAFATFQLVRGVIVQEKRRREEEQAREQRNRDEHLLDEIIRWATAVATARTERDVKTMNESRRIFEAEALRSVYILNIIEPFTFSLKEAVLKLNDVLLKHIELMTKYDEYKKSGDKDKRSKQAIKIRNHNGKISTIFIPVIDEATKAKINLLSH